MVVRGIVNILANLSYKRCHTARTHRKHPVSSTVLALFLTAEGRIVRYYWILLFEAD